jgi:hypothetical protein
MFTVLQNVLATALEMKWSTAVASDSDTPLLVTAPTLMRIFAISYLQMHVTH